MAGNVLGIGITGLSAAQSGLAVTGHNIANANTPGYTRQRVILEPVGGEADRFGVGRGVDVDPAVADQEAEQLHAAQHGGAGAFVILNSAVSPFSSFPSLSSPGAPPWCGLRFWPFF